MKRKYHYTYGLKRVLDGAYYIGVRSSSVAPELDTGYMSSSRTVKKEIQAGVQYKKKVLAVWPTRKKALAHEIELHNKHDVARSPKFLNKAKQTSTLFNREGVPHPPSVKKKIRNFWTPEEREACSAANSGENNPRYGTKHTEETKDQMRAAWTEARRAEKAEWASKNSPTRDPEVAARVSAKLKGRPKTEAHKEAMRGAKSEEGRRRISEYQQNAIWYTNGVKSVRLLPDVKPPKGFKPGKHPEKKYIHPKYPGERKMKSHWSRWANANLPESKIGNFMKQLVKEN